MSTDWVVHVIDDDDAIRDSLRFMLETSGYRVSLHGSADAFLAAFADDAHGVIVTDVRMPGRSGLDLLESLKESRASSMPVVVMTGHGDIALAVEAMRAGAIDFIEKPFPETRLLAALDRAKAIAVDRDALAAGRRDIEKRIATLSGREKDVMAGLVAGRPNKVIAHDLGISARTVEIYRANLMTKMKAGSLSELVRMALLAGG
jgi:two-component system response regulator FixJ